MRPRFNPIGILQHPNLHDGYLQAIAVSDDDTLTLRCKSVEGETWQVMVPRLLGLRADNFLEGNIIFDLTVHAPDRCTVEQIIWMNEYSGTDGTARAERRLANIVQSGWSIVEIDSSYGCELLALFDGGETDLVLELLVPGEGG